MGAGFQRPWTVPGGSAGIDVSMDGRRMQGNKATPPASPNHPREFGDMPWLLGSDSLPWDHRLHGWSRLFPDLLSPATRARIRLLVRRWRCIANLEPVSSNRCVRRRSVLNLTCAEFPASANVRSRSTTEDFAWSAYRADFLCYAEVLVELKALDRITPREQAQVIHYLKAMNLTTGLLINFGSQALQFNRLLNPSRHNARAISSV